VAVEADFLVVIYTQLFQSIISMVGELDESKYVTSLEILVLACFPDVSPTQVFVFVSSCVHSLARCQVGGLTLTSVN
jgi:hypothetical protein